MEINGRRNLILVKNIYQNCKLFGEKESSGWNIEYTCEFNQTTDSKLFDPLIKFENENYIKNEYCRWINSKGEIALPLYVGRMVGQYDFCKKGCY